MTTFEELRQQMREAEAKAREAAASDRVEGRPAAERTGKEMEVDFDIKNTGQTKTINGFDTRQVRRDDHRPREGQEARRQRRARDDRRYLADARQVSLKEIADFDRRYYEKLAGPVSAVDAQQMATAMAMFPGLKEAFARLSREDFGGTAIQTTTTIDAVKSAEQMKQQGSGSSASERQRTIEPGVDRRRHRRLHAPAPAAARSRSRRQPTRTRRARRS